MQENFETCHSKIWLNFPTETIVSSNHFRTFKTQCKKPQPNLLGALVCVLLDDPISMSVNLSINIEYIKECDDEYFYRYVANVGLSTRLNTEFCVISAQPGSSSN